MARTATIEHTATGITITVENATGHYTFDRAADGTYIQGCGKCSGTGWLTYHLNVQGGVCFDCDGTGRLRTMLDADTARKWAIRTVQRQERAAVKAEAKRLERLAAAEAEARADDVAEQEAVAVFTAAHPKLAAALARHASADAFVNRMLATVKVGCDLSEKQHAAVERAVRDLDHADAIAIEQAERGFAPGHIAAEGAKVDVTVRVVRAALIDGYAYNSSQNLITGTVAGGEWDGQAVVIYSTARWAYDTEPGDLVTLTGATVKRHSVYDGTPQTTLGGRMKAAKG